MRSRYPRNHINEDHYPIKQVVVFFYLHKVAKKSLSFDTLPKKCLKNEILSYTRTDEKTNSDIITEFAFFFSHALSLSFMRTTSVLSGDMKENARVVF